jgi:hypothetical protein
VEVLLRERDVNPGGIDRGKSIDQRMPPKPAQASFSLPYKTRVKPVRRLAVQKLVKGKVTFHLYFSFGRAANLIRYIKGMPGMLFYFKKEKKWTKNSC